jgi:hypothetical protein
VAQLSICTKIGNLEASTNFGDYPLYTYDERPLAGCWTSFVFGRRCSYGSSPSAIDYSPLAIGMVRIRWVRRHRGPSPKTHESLSSFLFPGFFESGGNSCPFRSLNSVFTWRARCLDSLRTHRRSNECIFACAYRLFGLQLAPGQHLVRYARALSARSP